MKKRKIHGFPIWMIYLSYMSFIIVNPYILKYNNTCLGSSFYLKKNKKLRLYFSLFCKYIKTN